MDESGDKFLIYLSTDDNKHVKCDIGTKSTMEEILIDFIGSGNQLPIETYTYEEYIK